MAFETPIQIDLSEENAWDNIDDTLLSEEEKEYLQRNYDSDKESIIYLTHEEVQKLRDIIRTQTEDGISIPVKDAMSGELDSFIEEQENEGISIQDMVEGMENMPEFITEQFDEIEEKVNEVLFGSEGMFSSLEVSPIAKDHIATSLMLSITHYGVDTMLETIESIDEDTPFDAEIFQEQILSEISEIETKLSDIKSIIDETTVIDEGGVSYEERKVNILDNGEGNRIFMELQTGRNFFDRIISGDITSENVEAEIEGANLGEGEEIQSDIAGESEAINGKVTEFIEAYDALSPEQQDEVVEAVVAASGAGNDTPEVTEGREEKGGFTKLFEAFFKFLQGFIGDLDDALSEVSGDDGTPEGDGGPQDPEDVAATPAIINKELLIATISESVILPGVPEIKVNRFITDGDNAEKIIGILNEIPKRDGEETPEDILNNMFQGDAGEDSENELQVFLAAGISAGKLPVIQERGDLYEDAFIQFLESYKNYRIAHATNDELTYEGYFADIANKEE